MIPIVDIQVLIDINKTTENTAFVTGVYTVVFTLLNQGPAAAEIRDKNNTVVATLTNQGDSANPSQLIELPELPYYSAKFIGSQDSVSISVSADAFATVIKDIVLKNSLDNYSKPDIVPTQYGYPAFEISYQGLDLADYLEAFQIEFEDNLVPFSVAGVDNPATSIALNTYKNRSNIPVLLKPISDQNVSYNGSDYSMNEGQMLLLKYSGDIENHVSSIFLHMKADDNLSSGISVSIYSDVLGDPTTLLTTGHIAKIDLSQTLSLNEIKLEDEIFIKDFWVLIVPLNSYSTHTLGLSDQSDIVETRFSRYVNGEDFGADAGKSYGEVVEDALDALYGSSVSYPVLVTDMEELVGLNKVFKDSLKLQGFNGPSFVVFEDGIQAGGSFIEYGLNQNRAISDIVSSINGIGNYEAKLVADSSVSAGNLFSMYREPSLNLSSPVTDIELLYSQFLSPDNTNRKIVVRMKAMSVGYETKNRIQLLSPLVTDTGEWRPRVKPGFIEAPALKVGDFFYDLNYNSYAQITDIDSSSITYSLINSSSSSASSSSSSSVIGSQVSLYTDIFEVIEPANFPVLRYDQVPIQLSAKAFELSRKPLYLEGGLPLFAFNTGEDLETPLASKLEDFDDQNGILVFPIPLRYDINKFVSYYYIEENYIESTIDVKVAPSSSVNIYLSANPATPLLALDTEEPIISYNDEICILLGSYRLTGDTSPGDIAIVDAREKGGGVDKELSYDIAFEKNPAVTGFYDIGYNTGKRIPQSVLTLFLPSSIRSVFTEEQINDIAYKHVTAGTKVYIEYKEAFVEDPSLNPSSSSGSSSSSS